MTTPLLMAELAAIHDRIEAAFAEDADRWTANKHACLEEVSERLADVIDRAPWEGDESTE